MKTKAAPQNTHTLLSDLSDLSSVSSAPEHRAYIMGSATIGNTLKGESTKVNTMTRIYTQMNLKPFHNPSESTSFYLFMKLFERPLFPSARIPDLKALWVEEEGADSLKRFQHLQPIPARPSARDWLVRLTRVCQQEFRCLYPGMLCCTL